MITDPHRLRQVMANLLSNAFKFTAHGEVAVTMELSANGWTRARAAHAGGSAIALRVNDTGIGIKEELQSAMFEAFAQADGTTARQYGGTGLGLSISRNLVSLLGGEITLVSEPGTGSTFTVYLPLEEVATTRREARAPPTPPSPARPPGANGDIGLRNADRPRRSPLRDGTQGRTGQRAVPRRRDSTHRRRRLPQRLRHDRAPRARKGHAGRSTGRCRSPRASSSNDPDIDSC